MREKFPSILFLFVQKGPVSLVVSYRHQLYSFVLIITFIFNPYYCFFFARLGYRDLREKTKDFGKYTQNIYEQNTVNRSSLCMRYSCDFLNRCTRNNDCIANIILGPIFARVKFILRIKFTKATCMSVNCKCVFPISQYPQFG